MNLFITGRKKTFKQIKSIQKNDHVIWFHAASLGEFEQGRPIIEKVRVQYPNHKIVVTFFSPSGYEVQKNYADADVVCYLPFDTQKLTERFIQQIHPNVAIIIKYEFWPNLLNTLYKQQIPTILVSGIFRKNQVFFKWYGGFMQKKLNAFNHFFVQDINSKNLLHSIGLNNTSVSGDTRFDRVHKILQQNNTLNDIEAFKNKAYTLVAGSTWKEDEKMLINYINNFASIDEKFIIAPHNIKKQDILNLKKMISKKTILYSEKENANLNTYQVLIIDTVGLLSKIYSYANIVYVGGGFGKEGVHNILEPATFGLPIVIGPIFKKFKEAVDLVNYKGCIVIKNEQEMTQILTAFKTNKTQAKTTGNINKKYIENHIGASQLILNYIEKTL